MGGVYVRYNHFYKICKITRQQIKYNNMWRSEILLSIIFQQALISAGLMAIGFVLCKLTRRDK
jgi:hypothetical protein